MPSSAALETAKSQFYCLLSGTGPAAAAAARADALTVQPLGSYTHTVRWRRPARRLEGGRAATAGARCGGGSLGGGEGGARCSRAEKGYSRRRDERADTTLNGGGDDATGEAASRPSGRITVLQLYYSSVALSYVNIIFRVRRPVKRPSTL